MIKNYTLSLMDGDIKLTAKEAAAVLQAWQSGAKFVIVQGNAYATHQITAIERVPRKQEDAWILSAGLLPCDQFGNLIKGPEYESLLGSMSLESQLAPPSKRLTQPANGKN